ncbi:MAG: cation-translocating P-type ATPase [Gammaproteobacteria bacterium]|nr:cation-translocating P-type ATPase [Gammaproteobacteria bacterium]
MGPRERGEQLSEAIRWHCLEPAAALERLGGDGERGLSAAEAWARLARHGPNRLAEGRRRTPLGMFLGQFADFMILVLLAAAVVSGAVGEPQDTAAILVIVLLNAIIGTVQEYRAERAVAALRRLAAPTARVIRDGAAVIVPGSGLVPGDTVLLEAGDGVPADLRLLAGEGLEADESALTGESVAVAKTPAALPDPELALAERRNRLWKGTLVTRGRGRGVVTATGMDTEIGRIAGLLGGAESVRTPLQKRLARFGRTLALAVLAICAFIFAAGLLQGVEPLLMLLTAISLAVAAIPEALPAVVTVALALGARLMSRSNALVRRLPAVETLGSVTVICSDKTGTLTENRMRVERLVAAGEERGALPAADTAAEPWRRLGQALALSNDVESGAGGAARGDPTELALWEAAAAAGHSREALAGALPRVAELPFDSERKRMSTVHGAGGRRILFTKGAPEQVLPLCTRELAAGGERPLDPEAALEQARVLAEAGYRVLALAWREAGEGEPEAALEAGLCLLGLAALADPPRAGAEGAVAECRAAGIVPVMITGDHPGTALAIARRLGIARDAGETLTGAELGELSDAAFAGRVESIRVYARVSPEQKLRIVKALQAHGEFVAMTGDGVNDAPALKRAGIGVAMGRKGTDVAREAADMVLLDDNFATIVAAVREGRRIFDNIRKFIKYTMTSNAGEIWTLFLAPLLGLPIPLLPIHILWINLVTDGLPGLALAAEPAERGIMDRPPRPPRESIFAHGMWQHMIWVGLLIGGLSILGQAWAVGTGSAHWQTVVFTVLTLAQLFHVLAVRSERESLFRRGRPGNPALLGAVLLTVGLQLAVIYLPALNGIFRTQPLSLAELGACFALAAVVLVAVEAEKALVRAGRLYRD